MIQLEAILELIEGEANRGLDSVCNTRAVFQRIKSVAAAGAYVAHDIGDWLESMHTVANEKHIPELLSAIKSHRGDAQIV